MSRILNTEIIIPIIEKLVKKACYELDDNLMCSFRKAYDKEESKIGKETIKILIDNGEYAKKEQLACCHDTGTCIVIMEIGQHVCWEGKPLKDQVNQGVRQGYENGYLRKSMVADPLERINTNDNTPAILHTEIVDGDRVTITVMPKGGGSENMGTFKTLLPGDGIDGIKDFVLETVRRVGGNPCPPYIIGIGVGGTMDHCSWMAKKALLRPLGEFNAKPLYAQLEAELLEAVNNTGIGPLGMGGCITALGVHVDYYPCHITALPVAINFQCNASRHASEII
ncbi:fumarate hydratase [Salmonella enterica]|nr:fumarate hydratase [Salmonella enterica subsp. enterica serovar Typhimurium]EHN0593518.1 fumarate hydratase [Salmonella enterica]EIS4339890.1 fumarate hydratase [Salmonella enterica]ELR0284230.1 fumarate hydratase [Salmonella enterica]ELR0451095.1 fumarate hydratase [Salmonella enterica]